MVRRKRKKKRKVKGTLSGVLEWSKREWREGKGKGLSSNFGFKSPFQISTKSPGLNKLS
jgi:hypothetical protein